jgi:excisionase family DNA binding protein
MSPRYSLREAAKRTGVNRFTLRRWIAELGFRLPEVKRGSKFLLSDADIAAVLAKNSPQRPSRVNEL